MSSHLSYPDDGRFDSALDMSASRHLGPDDDYEDTQSASASSVVEPWSQYNTRLQPDYPSVYADFDWSAYDPSPGDVAFTDYSMPTFDSSFDPFVRFTSPDPVTTSTYALTVNSSQPAPSNTTPSAGYSTSPFNRRHDPAHCPECGQKFTGTYRSGNLSRHRKQKHHDANEDLYRCTFSGCSSVFRRSDARLKHARRKHPEFSLPPAQSRPGPGYDSSSRSANGDTSVIKASHSPTSLTNSLPIHLQHGPDVGQLENLSAPARYIISVLSNRLDPAEFSRACDSLFTRWESVVEQLLDNKSDAHPVYAQVLEDLRLVVHAADPAGHRSHAPSDRHSSHSSSNKQARSRGNGIDSFGPSQPDRITKRSSSNGGAGKGLVDTVDKRAKIEGRQEVDCPVYKYHIMHSLLPPCRGCRVTVMSQVRSHLNPNRASGTHRGYPRFVEQCSRCKQDFVDRQTYDAHKAAESCAFERQTRGEILLPWARQYLTLYPNERRVPLPWPDSRGWIRESLLGPLRNSRADGLNPAAFLDERRHLSHPQTHGSLTDQANDAQYTGVMGHILHDLVNPTYTQSPSRSTAVLNETHDHTADLDSPFTGGTGSNSQYWQSILGSLESHQRTIREAASHLTMPQLMYMAMQSAHIFNISRGIYQEQQRSHAAQEQAPPAVGNNRLSAQSNDTTSRDLMPDSYSQTYSHSQPSHPRTSLGAGTSSPTTTRTRSDRSYAARSSQHLYSTPTNPSSSYSPHNPNFLSPYSPSDYRRTSLPSNVLPDAPQLSRALPSRRSLPDDADDCISPSLLDSSHDEESPGSFDLPFYSPGNGY